MKSSSNKSEQVCANTNNQIGFTLCVTFFLKKRILLSMCQLDHAHEQHRYQIYEYFLVAFKSKNENIMFFSRVKEGLKILNISIQSTR